MLHRRPLREPGHAIHRPSAQRVAGWLRHSALPLLRQVWYSLSLAQPHIEPPVFVIGTIRSGSTLTAKCLGRHSKVYYTGRELLDEWSRFAGIEITRSHARMEHCPPYSQSDATEARCHAARAGFGGIQLHGAKRGSARLLDKNPHLWNKLPLVREIFPAAHFVVTSRDIRSTVASIKAFWGRRNQQNGNRWYIPESDGYCYTLVPPGEECRLERSRTFPGGDVAVLAEYWLRTYETIQEGLAGCTRALPVKHRELTANPFSCLDTVFRAMDLPPATYDLPVQLDLSRNDRWRTILDLQEQKSLEAFIERNRDRIQRLRFADTWL